MYMGNHGEVSVFTIREYKSCILYIYISYICIIFHVPLTILKENIEELQKSPDIFTYVSFLKSNQDS